MSTKEFKTYLSRRWVHAIIVIIVVVGTASFTALVYKSVDSSEAMTARKILAEYDEPIQAAVDSSGVPAELIASVIMIQSAGRSDVVGEWELAKGLMLLTQSVCDDYGVIDPLDPAQNIMGGALLLRDLLIQFEGHGDLSLAAYSAGAKTISRYNRIPDEPQFEETQRFVDRTLALYNELIPGVDTVTFIQIG